MTKIILTNLISCIRTDKFSLKAISQEKVSSRGGTAAYFIRSLNASGNSGIAPLCVQTYAETSVANLCASGTAFPLRMAAVKESPTRP